MDALMPTGMVTVIWMITMNYPPIRFLTIPHNGQIGMEMAVERI